MSKLYVFIDNGTTGTIGAYNEEFQDFRLTPSRKEQNYTKKKQNITVIDHVALKEYLAGLIEKAGGVSNMIVIMERPMTNTARSYIAVESAARAYETTKVIIEQLGIPRADCDSKQWQRGILPSSGKRGTTSAMLKKESMDYGLKQFPMFADLIKKHKDADGIVGAYSFYKQKLF